MPKQETRYNRMVDPSLDEVWEAFRAAMADLGLTATFDVAPAEPVRWDAVGSIEGIPVAVELKAAPTAADVLALERMESAGAYKVLAGRRLSRAARDQLAERGIGYFDGRGHLRLWHPPMLIDAEVRAIGPSAPGGGAPRLEVPSLLDVALGVLDGVARRGVRAAAASMHRSPGTVSKQLAVLRRAHLADDEGNPMVPDLFDAVLEVWHPVRVPLAELPHPGDGRVNERLQLNLDDPEAPGWVLSDAFAAAAWGAPAVLSSDAPPDFYVPTSSALRLARTLLGDAEFDRRACTVAVAPSPFVCRRRYDRASVFDEPFFAPSPVVAALDLARDPARGRELLEQWSRNLPAEVSRVW